MVLAPLFVGVELGLAEQVRSVVHFAKGLPLLVASDADEDGDGDILATAPYDVGTDCNDDDGTEYPGAVTEAAATECMRDADADGFIAFDSLTEANVLGWVHESVDKDETEAALAADIAGQKTPVTTDGVPW